MTLKITKASEPITIDTGIFTLYGAPGGGKSSVAFSSDAPLGLDFDGGSYRAVYRPDIVAVQRWSEVNAITPTDLEPYNTIVVDTVGRALDVMAVQIAEDDPKNTTRSGALSLQGYGALKASFNNWLNHLRSLGKNIVLVAHMDEKSKGDDLIERIDVQGGSKNEIYKVSDAMGRITIQNRKRVILFSPTDTAFGKNPAGFGPIEIPHMTGKSAFFAEIMAKTLAHLNTLSEEQQEVVSMIEEWKGRVDKATEKPSTAAKNLTALIPVSNDLDDRVKLTAKQILRDKAKDCGFEFDAKTKGFVAIEKEQVAS